MTTATAKWTVTDYHRMIDAGILDDRRVELLDGEIVEMAPEGVPHAFYSDRFATRLRALLGDRAQVREGKPITLSNQSEPEPDIAVVQPLAEVYLDHHPYPENCWLLIEYSYSSLAKDLEDKSQVYAAAGIQDYWVVNLRDRELVVFRSPQGKTYQQKTTLATGTIAPLAFPEIEVQVSQLMNR